MFQRPLFTSLIVIGIATAALRVDRGPPLPFSVVADQGSTEQPGPNIKD
jgi:hypothetical protein